MIAECHNQGTKLSYMRPSRVGGTFPTRTSLPSTTWQWDNPPPAPGRGDQFLILLRSCLPLTLNAWRKLEIYRSRSTSNFHALSSTSNLLKLSQESWPEFSLVSAEADAVIIHVQPAGLSPCWWQLEQTLADFVITYNTPPPSFSFFLI